MHEKVAARIVTRREATVEIRAGVVGLVSAQTAGENDNSAGAAGQAVEVGHCNVARLLVNGATRRIAILVLCCRDRRRAGVRILVNRGSTVIDDIDVAGSIDALTVGEAQTGNLSVKFC